MMSAHTRGGRERKHFRVPPLTFRDTIDYGIGFQVDDLYTELDNAQREARTLAADAHKLRYASFSAKQRRTNRTL